MRRLKTFIWGLVVILASLFVAPLVFGQDSTHVIPFIPPVQPGFDWIYIPIFALGMMVHFIMHVQKAVGWSKLFSDFIAQFASWFFNKFHLTLITGAVAAILGVASTYGLNVSFGTLNALGIAVAIAAGYIADSAFNGSSSITVTQSPPPTK